MALSFFDYDITGEISWRGLDHFQRMIADPLFWRAMGTTLIYTVCAVPIALVLSTVMALGVRRAFRGARFFRSIFFLPVITLSCWPGRSSSGSSPRTVRGRR